MITSTRPTGRIKRVLLYVFVVVLVTAGSGALAWGVNRGNRCSEGVWRHGPRDECVGVSDGRFAFATELKGVSDKIYMENKSIDRSKPYVSVAYLLPMTIGGRDAAATTETNRRELVGAYVAQHEGNRTGRPPIRLLLANPGDDGAQWEPVVQQLKEMRASDNLVAVAGVSKTLPGTVKAIQALTRDDIAVFGSTLSGENLSGMEGLVRVAPTNRDEARAMVAHAELHPAWKKVMLVRDTTDDPYSNTLAEQFQLALRGSGIELVGQPERYDSSRDGYENLFTLMAGNICNQQPQIVYFAGRGTHLKYFANALAARTCQGKHLTVLTGDDANVLSGDEEFRKKLGADLTVQFTGQAHPSAWDGHPAAFSPDTVRRFQPGGFYETQFAEVPLSDGQAIMGHDAVMTAAAAVRIAARDDTREVRADTVFGYLGSLHGNASVGGASGWISICPDGDPENKAIPILEFLPWSSDVQKPGIGFISLSSRTGRPKTGVQTGGRSACD
ncbi:ABC transporter substrate-binding protein [Flindersiella endophytica]